MEFAFSINSLFGEEISRVDQNLAPFRRASNEPLDRNLTTLIDQMGEASAKAQGLHGPITAAYKLRNSDHRVYILKDPEANSGKGAAVGFIKVGPKKLFILDHHGAQVELTPLCVLDFYVHESRQRTGCGHRLFQHMIRAEKIAPQHLAIDRPSNKFTRFLKKHYNLSAAIPQVNNFVVFEGFFRDNPASRYGRKQSSQHNRPPLYPYRREGSYVTSRQRGSYRTLQQEKEALQNIAVTQGRPSSTGLLISRTQQLQGNRNRSSSLSNLLGAVGLGADDRRMGAQASGYSRHAQDSPVTQGQRSGAQRSPLTQGQRSSGQGSPVLQGQRSSAQDSQTRIQQTFPDHSKVSSAVLQRRSPVEPVVGQQGSTAGQPRNTAGQHGFTGEQHGSRAGQQSSEEGQLTNTNGQPVQASHVQYRDITTRNGHLKVSSQHSQQKSDNSAVPSVAQPPPAGQDRSAGSSSSQPPSLQERDALLRERDLSYTLTAQQTRRENSFWNVMGVPTTTLKDYKKNQRTNNIW